MYYSYMYMSYKILLLLIRFIIIIIIKKNIPSMSIQCY